MAELDNLFNLAGRVAVVTGGSGNLGPIWVDTLRKAGAHVAVLDLPEYDVRKKGDVEDFRRKLLLVYDKPTIIVNNAAIDNPPGSAASFWGNVRPILDTNLVGAANVTEAFLADMMQAGGGVVINIGSIMGNIGADWRNYEGNFEKPVAYNLSKAALIQFSRSLTTQYGRYGIRGVTLSFAAVDTGKMKPSFVRKFLKNVPLQKLVEPKSLRAALLFAIACPDLAGTQVLIDGGYCAW